MKKENMRFHLDALAAHQSILFDTLIYPHNLITESVKLFTFEDDNGSEMMPLRGYIAIKETNGKKEKYFVEDMFYDSLPFRVNDTEELLLKESNTKKSVVLRPLNPTPFKIKPEQTFKSIHQFIDELAPFEHSNPDGWFLLKICGIMGYVGKIFIGISSNPECGKSSIYEIIHSLTKKSPVFQPRSIPGILIQITGDGNIVFDEVHESNAEVKRCMENFTLQVAGNKPVYINGAMKTSNTKTKYDVSQQSITFLYNTYENYRDPQNEFFDNIFSNNGAMESRLLKLKFDGKLTEKFDKDFDVFKVAEENKMYYIKTAKMLLWLKHIKLSNAYARRYDYSSKLHLKGRHKLIYDEITWLIDMYAHDLSEYEKFIHLLDKCIVDYRDMIGKHTYYDKEEKEQKIIEESIVEFDEKCLTSKRCSYGVCTETECNIGADKKPYCRKHFKG